jgi:hypothetical protein
VRGFFRALVRLPRFRRRRLTSSPMTDDTQKSDAAGSEEQKVDPLGRPEGSDQYDPNAVPESEDDAYDAKAKPAD